MVKPRKFTQLEEADIISEFHSSGKITSTTLALKYGVGTKIIKKIIDDSKFMENYITSSNDSKEQYFFVSNVMHVGLSGFTDTRDVFINNTNYYIVSHLSNSDIGTLLSSITEKTEVIRTDHEHYEFMVTCKVFDEIETYVISVRKTATLFEYENTKIDFLFNMATPYAKPLVDGVRIFTKLEIAKELKRNSPNRGLTEFLSEYIFHIGKSCQYPFEDEHFIRLDNCITYIENVKFDITGWMLFEIPIFYSHCFVHIKSKKRFDLTVWDIGEVIPRYINNVSCEEDAGSISEAIEKYCN